MTAKTNSSIGRVFVHTKLPQLNVTPARALKCTLRFSLYKLLYACHGVPLDRQYLDVLPTVHLDISTLWLGDAEVRA